jgi:hypothetical protein
MHVAGLLFRADRIERRNAGLCAAPPREQFAFFTDPG